MKSRFQILLIFLFATLLWTCAKKKYPESEVENDPVYYSRFSVDGSQKEIKAGVDDYYLYSAYSQDSDLVYNLTSRFNKTGCEKCPGTLKIQINGANISTANGPMAIDSVLQVKKYDFLEDGAGLAYVVEFASTYNKTAILSNYVWSFSGGQQINGATPTHTFTKPGKYDVCLNVTGIAQCVSSNCNFLNIGGSGLRSFVTCTALPGQMMNFSQNTAGGKPFYQYLWNFGDGATSTLASPTHTYNFEGAYAVSLRVIDANSDTVFTNFNAITKFDLSSCAANYYIKSINTIAINNLSKVAISWIDDAGIEYRSAAATQPIGSSFEIISVSQGTPNEKGELTKKVVVKFNCRLFNGTRAVNLQNAEATIAVAYK